VASAAAMTKLYLVSNETSQVIKQPVFYIVDLRTGEQVGSDYKSRSRASARADKLDNAYGAYRYQVRSK